MRRAHVFIAMLFFVMQMAIASARPVHLCCVGHCDDAVMCVADACSACTLQAVLPVSPAKVKVPNARDLIAFTPATPQTHTVFDIWRPPPSDVVLVQALFFNRI